MPIRGIERMQSHSVTVNILGYEMPLDFYVYYKRRGFNEEKIKALFISKTTIDARAFHGKANPPSKPDCYGCGCQLKAR